MRRAACTLLLALLAPPLHAEGSHQMPVELWQALLTNAAILLTLLLIPMLYVLIRGILSRIGWLLVLVVVDGCTLYLGGSMFFSMPEQVAMSPLTWAAFSVPGFVVAFMHMHQARRVPAAPDHRAPNPHTAQHD